MNKIIQDYLVFIQLQCVFFLSVQSINFMYQPFLTVPVQSSTHSFMMLIVLYDKPFKGVSKLFS